MVCNRCIMVVEAELKQLGFGPSEVSLGEAIFKNKLTDVQKAAIDQHLQQFGFELIDDKKHRMVEKVKNVIVDLVHHQPKLITNNLSAYLNDQLHLDYNYISNIFSEIENNTIEKFYINQRIERVKELISYDEYSLSEIADLLQYSSVAYLSSQFKKVTGISPSQYKQQQFKERKPLDKV